MQRRSVLLSGSAILAGATLPVDLRAQPVADGVVRLRPVSFPSEGAVLAGTLYLPSTAPVGGIVLVHGSGRRTRIDWAARFFAQRGLAVLSYDKRGVGESGGTYEDLDNASNTNLKLLAADAAAAAEALRRRPEMAGRRLGYWGISQAGWVIPLALQRSPSVDFVVLWSGPTCTVTEDLEARSAESGSPAAEARIRAYIDYLRVKQLDTDPRDALRRIGIPGLWIYGGKDNARIVQLSIDRLKSLIGAGQTNFSYWLNSAGGHDDFAANGPLLEASAQWMLAQVKHAPRT